jgi:SAM-dependent methyltransferase
MTCFPRDLVLADDRIYVPRDEAPLPFDYSDGDAEETHIYNAIRNARDLSSGSFELEGSIHDWPTRYHLSRERANLIRHLPLSQFKTALEIGAGCGAITRYLSEQCSDVVAVDGSRRRSRIARARCADRANVRVVCCDFARLQFDVKFDLVVVVGVLEYACRFFRDCPDPWGAFIRAATNALSEKGVLLIAIENQFGVKYFGGAPEDHTAVVYEGVEGYHAGARVRTFSRPHLQSLLGSAGLTSRFYLPFPDYKLPRVVLDADHIDTGLRLGQWCDQCGPATTFAADLVYDELERHGLLADYANSFLVAARRGLAPFQSDECIAIVYSTRRRIPFQRSTRLLKRDGHYAVRKDPFDAESGPRWSDSDLAGTESEYIIGDKLSLLMLRAMRSLRPAAASHFIALLERWSSYLRSASLNNCARGELLPTEYIDCTPSNLIVNGNGMHFVDREWTGLPFPVDIKFVLIRGLYYFGRAYGSQYAKPLSPVAIGPFITREMRRLGYCVTRGDLRRFAKQEEAFQRYVLPESLHCGKMLEEIHLGLGFALAPRQRLRHFVKEVAGRGLVMLKRR